MMRVSLVLPALAVATLGMLSCGPGSGADPKAVPPAPPSSPVSKTAPAPVSAAPSSTCPPTLVAAQTLTGGVAGWEPFEDDTPVQLMSVSVFDGHPRERASLVPDSDTASAGRRGAGWVLPGDGPPDHSLAGRYHSS